MSLKEKISKEIIAAMKAKDKLRLDVLRYLKKLFIENDTSKKPIDEQDIVISHAKKIEDSLSMFPEGSDQYLRVEKEIAILKEYLPSPLNESEVREMIEKIIAGMDNANMGSIMKLISPQIKGRFNGKRATEIVKELLS